MPALAAAIVWAGVLGEAMRGVDGSAVVASVRDGREVAAYGPERWAAPGSTIKPFVLAILLEEGARKGSTAVSCDGKLEIAGRNFHCSHPRIGTPIDGATAIAYSCNRYFADAGTRADAAKLRERLRQYGFTVDASAGGPLLALGESGVRVTPRALLGAYLKLARRKSDPALAPVFEGLRDAVRYGTAQLAGEGAAGKTGTTASAGRTLTHAWFAGWWPSENPEWAAVVFVANGRGGASAAPIAGRILAAPSGRTIRVQLRGDGAIRAFRLEDYVAAAVSGEAADFPNAESLKAMAVAVRTFAVAHRGRHAQEGFDFCDGTHCQNLRNGKPAERFLSAADATAGELLWHRGTTARIYYHRDCGGVTESAHDVWGGAPVPYLTRVTDTFCGAKGHYRWRAEVAAKDLAVLARSASGRVARLRVDGRAMGFDEFQHGTGSRVRAAFFQASHKGAGYLLEGYGDGHGVGLCQTGAAERARQGQSYRDILAFYYPGTRVGITAAGLTWTRISGERITLASTRAEQDKALLSSAEAALREAERRTGWRAERGVELRVYPTVAAFRDATGEPGWIAASTSGRTIRMTAAGTAALLHECLHVLVESRARRSLPDWFREGLVLHLEGGSPRSSQAAGPEADMRRAYQSARERVGGLVRKHGLAKVLTWVETGVPAEANVPLP